MPVLGQPLDVFSAITKVIQAYVSKSKFPLCVTHYSLLTAGYADNRDMDRIFHDINIWKPRN
jgi:hypothetical protein